MYNKIPYCPPPQPCWHDNVGGRKTAGSWCRRHNTGRRLGAGGGKLWRPAGESRVAAAVTVHYCTVLYSRGEYQDGGILHLPFDKDFDLQSFFQRTCSNLKSLKCVCLGSWRMGVFNQIWPAIGSQSSTGMWKGFDNLFDSKYSSMSMYTVALPLSWARFRCFWDICSFASLRERGCV